MGHTDEARSRTSDGQASALFHYAIDNDGSDDWNGILRKQKNQIDNLYKQWDTLSYQHW